MPVSSLEIATTGTLYFFTKGSINAKRSSSPVTEFSSGRPLATLSPASSAPGTELSIHKGISTVFCTNSIIFSIKGGSVIFGSGLELYTTPALTSRTAAPQATCSQASFSTVEKSPASSCAANFLRPVGLIRSPITQNGWSKPMMTVLLLLSTTVRVMLRSPFFDESIRHWL